MSKFLKITGGGDYKIKVDSGQEITLDTGSGTVNILGDLNVTGSQTTIDTVNLEIEDNVIILNRNETATEVSAGFSGIQVDRGSATTGDVEWVYAENIGNWYESRLGSNNSDGLFVARYTNNPTRVLGIRTYDIDSDGDDLNLVGGGSGRVLVKGTNSYETGVFAYINGSLDSSYGAARVTQTTPILLTENTDDVIPNAKAVVDFVDAKISSTFSYKIEKGISNVEVIEPGPDPDGRGEVHLTANGVLTTVFTAEQTQIHGVTISGSTIQVGDNNTGEDLILAATGTNSVRVDDSLIISQSPYIGDGIDPNAPGEGEGTKLYSKPRGSGDTGVFFANTKDGTEKRDELVSKSKAILFGILF
jgi:hypothetical protein